jgi:hypothetical protein
MLIRFSIFGLDVIAVGLQWPDFDSLLTGGDEPKERLRLGTRTELADYKQHTEDRFELPTYGFGPTAAPPKTE